MIGIVIQARTGSSRFPRKIFQDINGKSTLQRVLDGCSKSKLPHKIILAMPEYDKQELIKKIEKGELVLPEQRFSYYFGHPDDLVARYFNAARDFCLNTIVRVTADCPMIQGNIIDEMLISYFKNGGNFFMGNNELVSNNPYPDGTDVEIFPYWMLSETMQLTQDPVHREHVTPFMYRRGTEYKLVGFDNSRPNTMIDMRFSDYSFDTQEDYELLEKITKIYDSNGEDLNDAIRKA